VKTARPAKASRSGFAGRLRGAARRKPRGSGDDALRSQLDELVRTSDVVSRRANDPVDFVHRYHDPNDREVVGLLAATLAFGNVVAVRRSIARVLEVLGPAPHRAIDDERRLARALKGFVHRVYRGAHVARMLASAAKLRASHGSLGHAFVALLAEEDARTPDREAAFREALARLAEALRGSTPHERGLEHLVPDPRRGSACKRLLLYLRWMIRPADGVDLGLWPVDPARLVIPVDTHIHRIATNLGLTRRADASWKTAHEITTRLRVLDARDPVRYDFALCHLGVSRDCPSRRDPVRCEGCVLRTVCLRWAE
jgi:uncharacterized protein (TIGR02757 family)